MFLCSHTKIHRELRNLPQNTVGAELRVYLPEDETCLVEDFLFSRKCGIFDRVPLLMRLLLLESVCEDDFDGLLFVFSVYLHFAPCPDSRTELEMFRSVQSEYCLGRLLSLGVPAPDTIRDTIMFYAICGRLDLLQRVCHEWEWKVPRDVLGITIFELRYSERSDVCPPVGYPLVHWEYLHELICHHTATPPEGRELQEKRRQCLQFLLSHRAAMDGFA